MDHLSPSRDNEHPDEQGLASRRVWTRQAVQDAANPESQADMLAEEVPIALIYNGISHVVMMATPLNLPAFALGFSLSEGIIDSPAEIYGMDVVPQCGGIEVQIELSSRRFMALKEQRRAMAGRTAVLIIPPLAVYKY